MRPYKTVAGSYSASQIIERSRFIGNVESTADIAEANSFILRIKKKYHDATHNCYAYLNIDGQKFSDDGEPGGTAGLSIFEVIKKSSLTNICIVVTRYFGGIKLGAPGLVRAYSSTASLTLKSASIVEYKLFANLFLCVPYNFFPLIKTTIDAFRVADIVYDKTVNISVNVLAENVDSFISNVINATNGVVIPQKCDFLLLPVQSK